MRVTLYYYWLPAAGKDGKMYHEGQCGGEYDGKMLGKMDEIGQDGT